MTTQSAPILIECARVLHYATVDEGVRYTPRSAIYVNGEELGAVARLAIVRNLVDQDIMLLHCDSEWNVLGSSGSGDVESVMTHANRRYEGLDSRWQKAPWSDVEFAKALTDQFRDQRCSFCGRYHFQVDSMMVEGDRAMICGECIVRLYSASVDNLTNEEPDA